MNAKAFLSEIKKIEKQIENKQAERAQWRDIALNITGNYDGERVQSSGNPHKLENAVINAVDIEREIDECIVRLYKRRQDIIKVIEQLPINDYDLLYKVYVQGVSFQEIADEKGCTYSNITTLHGMVLKRVMRILDAQQDPERAKV